MIDASIPEPNAPVPSPRADVSLQVADPRWRDGLADVEALVTRAAAAAMAVADPEPEDRPFEISILLSDDAAVRTLNRDYRDLDKPTNVLSFPARDDDRETDVFAEHDTVLLGDIVVAFETTMREAEAEGKGAGDHLAHLVVHGVLHLLGLDHEDDAEAEEMERLEVRALGGLGIPDPYADGGSPAMVER